MTDLIENNRLRVIEPLVDLFGRKITYLRISVTDRCNLRCIYCMAEDMRFVPRQQILDLQEIISIAAAFTELGVRKIRLTGGEPLLRRGIVTLAEQLKSLPNLEELVLTTNGLLLPRYGSGLMDAGVRRLNISLDSLKSKTFRKMTRSGTLTETLNGIEHAAKIGFKVKLNVVVLAGVNDGEVSDLTAYALGNGFDISFIEEMPLGHIDSHNRVDTVMLSEAIHETLMSRFSLAPLSISSGGPARYYAAANYGSKVGFISPLSDNFCGSCNRVRLTAEGKLILCLGNEHSLDLKALIRCYPGEPERLRDAIVTAMVDKPEKHHFDPESVEIVRFMNATGG